MKTSAASSHHAMFAGTSRLLVQVGSAYGAYTMVSRFFKKFKPSLPYHVT